MKRFILFSFLLQFFFFNKAMALGLCSDLLKESQTIVNPLGLTRINFSELTPLIERISEDSRNKTDHGSLKMFGAAMMAFQKAAFGIAAVPSPFAFYRSSEPFNYNPQIYLATQTILPEVSSVEGGRFFESKVLRRSTERFDAMASLGIEYLAAMDAIKKCIESGNRHCAIRMTRSLVTNNQTRFAGRALFTSEATAQVVGYGQFDTKTEFAVAGTSLWSSTSGQGFDTAQMRGLLYDAIETAMARGFEKGATHFSISALSISGAEPENFRLNLTGEATLVGLKNPILGQAFTGRSTYTDKYKTESRGLLRIKRQYYDALTHALMECFAAGYKKCVYSGEIRPTVTDKLSGDFYVGYRYTSSYEALVHGVR